MIGAFFDIDGTICRNSLLTEHFKKMIKYELIDSLEYEEKVRETMKEISGTLPEELPTPEKSVKELEKEKKLLGKKNVKKIK